MCGIRGLYRFELGKSGSVAADHGYTDGLRGLPGLSGRLRGVSEGTGPHLPGFVLRGWGRSVRVVVVLGSRVIIRCKREITNMPCD